MNRASVAPALDRLLGQAFRSADVDVRRRARVLLGFSVCMILGICILAVFVVATGIWANLPGLVLLLSFGVAIITLLRRGRSLGLLATLTALMLFGVAAQGAVAMGGIGAPPLNWFSVLPLLVLLLAGPRAGVAFAALGVLGHTAFFVAAQNGFGQANVAPVVRFGDALVVTGFVFAFALLYERFKQRAIDEMRIAHERIEVLQAQLVDAAHRAGMAEVSASVLHNAGNALNHVTTGAALASERLAEIRLEGLTKLAAKLASDASGSDQQRIAAYAAELARTLGEQRDAVASELASIQASLAHVAAVIDSQQHHTESSEPDLEVDLRQALEDVLRLERAACRGRPIAIETHLDEVAPIVINKHRVLLVVVNLFRNAVHAVEETEGKAGRIEVRLADTRDCVTIAVTDSGTGIAPEDRAKLFRQGFTTKANGPGHGHGLHSSALAAKKLGGKLTCESEGRGKGATFVLEIPRAPALEAPAPAYSR